MKRLLKWVVMPLVFIAIGIGLMKGWYWVFPPKGEMVVQTADADLARNIGGAGSLAVPTLAQGTIIEVRDGDSIQQAVLEAQPGDTVMVFPGTYSETVYIDKDDIVLLGVTVEGNWPTMDGKKELNDAILYSGSDITIDGFKITNYKGNAIMGQAGNNFIIRNNLVIDTGVYGIFPQFGTNGLIEHNILSGIEDAAIYVGMSDNIDVRHNEVFENVAGIEIENTRHALVENNYVYNNAGGILAFITPGLPIKTTYDVIIRDNFVVNNNHVNFAEPGSIVANVPQGTGILVMAADDVVIENNIITGNNSVGIGITDLSLVTDVSKDPGSEPNPDGLVILDNIMYNNGSDPKGILKDLVGLVGRETGPDIMDTGKGSNKCITDVNRYETLFLLGADYGVCDRVKYATDGIFTMNLPELAPTQVAQDVSAEDFEKEIGKRTYFGVCTGCHTYSVRMIGPSVKSIQALYFDDPEGIAAYINDPIKKREDYPEMPPQNYLTEETRMAVAKYMLGVTK
jgi:parallel beta-helix repeat protein